MTDTDIVRAAVDAYQRQDAVAADRLLALDFVLTSPQDDHIDKAAYLEVRFPRRIASRTTSRSRWLRPQTGCCRSTNTS